MPYKNEHACRLHDPDEYQKDSFRRIARDNLSIIIGRREGETTTEAQAYRYPVDDWAEADAEAHCKEAGGTFEAAAEDKEEKAISFDDQQRQIRDAWSEQHRKQPSEVYTDDYWVDAVFDEYVIVKTPEGLSSYSYTIDEDGKVKFDEPIKVEVEYVPVATRSMGFAIKSLGETEEAWIIGGYGLVWGSEERRDLSPWPNEDGTRGEFFTPQTKGLDDIPIKVLTFEHDLEETPDGDPFKEILGTTLLERDELLGRWLEAQIEKRHKYATYVMELVDRGALNFSSETARHWREVAKNGEIKRWRTAGYTMTTHPMEPRSTDIEHIQSAYKSMGLELPIEAATGLPEEPPHEPNGDDVGTSCEEVLKLKTLIDILLSEIELMEVN